MTSVNWLRFANLLELTTVFLFFFNYKRR